MSISPDMNRGDGSVAGEPRGRIVVASPVGHPRGRPPIRTGSGADRANGSYPTRCPQLAQKFSLPRRSVPQDGQNRLPCAMSCGRRLRRLPRLRGVVALAALLGGRSRRERWAERIQRAGPRNLRTPCCGPGPAGPPGGIDYYRGPRGIRPGRGQVLQWSLARGGRNLGNAPPRVLCSS